MVRPSLPAARPRPLVVHVDGGGRSAGDRTRPAHIVMTQGLAQRGAVMAVPDLRPQDSARFVDFMTDAAEAIARARPKAGSLGADPAQVHLAGD
jgi:acetyl esterase/lipase